MEHTIKAILFGRCAGDAHEAWRYCMDTFLDTRGLPTSLEYLKLATIFQNMEADKHEQSKRTRTFLSAGCGA